MVLQNSKWKSGKIISRTRSHQYFIPRSDHSLQMIIHIIHLLFVDAAFDQFVSCRYEFAWYIGIICEKNYEAKDAKIQFIILNKRTKF